MTQPFHLIHHPTVATGGFHRDRRVRRKPCQKLPVKLMIVSHAQRLAGVTLFVHGDEHGKSLVCIASDKLFHIAAVPPFRGFARSLCETPLQRFHSISLLFAVSRGADWLEYRHAGPLPLVAARFA